MIVMHRIARVKGMEVVGANLHHATKDVKYLKKSLDFGQVGIMFLHWEIYSLVIVHGTVLVVIYVTDKP